MKKIMFRFILFSFFLIIPPNAGAEDMLTAHLNESFDNTIKAGGIGTIVGASIGPLSGNADPAMIKLPQGKLPNRTPVCLNLVTQDGVYHANLSLESLQGKSSLVGINPDPIWRYRAELSHYSVKNLAVSARTGANCDVDPASPILPVSFQAATGPLDVAVNVPRAFGISASVSTSKARSATVNCQAAQQGERVEGFNYRCEIPLDDIPRQTSLATLDLSIRDSGSDRHLQFKLLLPDR